MENFENTQSQTEEYVLKIRGTGLKDLNEVRRWAKFFAILGFIAIGLFTLMAIGMAVGFSVLGSSSELSTLGVGESLIIVMVMAVFIVLYIFPTLYLWRFALHARQALEAKDDTELAESMLYLRKYARFTGILAIVILALYILMIPVMMFTALATAL